jgi:hypothetical protein
MTNHHTDEKKRTNRACWRRRVRYVFAMAQLFLICDSRRSMHLAWDLSYGRHPCGTEK